MLLVVRIRSPTSLQEMEAVPAMGVALCYVCGLPLCKQDVVDTKSALNVRILKKEGGRKKKLNKTILARDTTPQLPHSLVGYQRFHEYFIVNRRERHRCEIHDSV